LALLIEAGWPKSVGPNDKRKASHDRRSLDRSRVETFWTKGHPFFVYDPAFKTVVTGKTLEAALLAMVEVRETLSAQRFPMEADSRNAIADDAKA
jgi:hypothetical protein